MLSKLAVAATATAAILGTATLVVQPASAATVAFRSDHGGRMMMGNGGGNMGGDDWWRFHHRHFDGPNVGFGFGFNTGPDYYYDQPSYTYVEPSYSYSYARPAYAYDADAYCAARFRSWNPVTHTYMGYDGLPHPCP